MTLAEHHAQLKAEGKWDDYVARKQDQSNTLARMRAELAAAEAPLVEELRSAGLDIDSVWDLVNTAERYPDAIPVLFEHLHKPYPEKIVEGILRALAVPESKSGWRDLLSVFEAAPSKDSGGLRWAAGCALGAAADDGVIAEVMRIVSDLDYGFDRATLLPALGRSHDARASMLLHELRADPVIGKEVKKLRRMNRKLAL